MRKLPVILDWGVAKLSGAGLHGILQQLEMVIKFFGSDESCESLDAPLGLFLTTIPVKISSPLPHFHATCSYGSLSFPARKCILCLKEENWLLVFAPTKSWYTRGSRNYAIAVQALLFLFGIWRAALSSVNIWTSFEPTQPTLASHILALSLTSYTPSGHPGLLYLSSQQ